MKHEEHTDPNDPRTTLMVIEPGVCETCMKRAKCRYREAGQRHKCPSIRTWIGGEGER